MLYSCVAIIALFTTFAIHADIIFQPKKYLHTKAGYVYRYFLFAVSAFFVSDLLWGILDELNLLMPSEINTYFFFLIFGLSLLLWTYYVAIFLKRRALGNALLVCGIVLFLTIFAFLIVNFFTPIMFRFDKEGVYHPGFLRFLMFDLEGALMLFAAIASFIVALRSDEKTKHLYFVVAIFSITMAVTTIVQLFLPLYPIVSMGLLLGLCLSRSFLISGELQGYKNVAAQAAVAEKRHERELHDAQRIMNVDTLTGAYSRYAYVEMEERMDLAIAAREITEFAVVVFDLNGLKHINDTKGHSAGDVYIIDSYKLISSFYPDCSIYRFGGDEFVVVLEGEAFTDRDKTLRSFEKTVNENLQKGLPVISTGMSVFDPAADNTFRAVFSRADERMYARKLYLKSKGAYVRDGD